jgi:glycosyltransferase involved in cell wall biosynthesis
VAAADITVIIPTWNRLALLVEALASVRAQTLAPAEVIVVDDGSSDGTGEWLRAAHPEVQYFYQEHGGISVARNLALRESRGEWVALLDDDDLWRPAKLQRQMERARECPEVELWFCHHEEVREGENGRLAVVRGGVVTNGASGVLCKREAMLRTGGFDPSFQRAEFLDWHVRAREAGVRVGMLAEVLWARRLHKNNSSRNLAAVAKEQQRVLRRMLGKRRQGGA